MRKVLVSKVGDSEILIGEPDRLVEHGGIYTAALGRLFQGQKDGQTMVLTHLDGRKETFFLIEVE